MTIDYFLMALIVLLLGHIYITGKETTKQTNVLIRAVIAKHSQDMVNMDLAEKTQVLANHLKDEPEQFKGGPLGPMGEDLVPLDSDPELFDQMISDQLDPRVQEAEE